MAIKRKGEVKGTKVSAAKLAKLTAKKAKPEATEPETNRELGKDMLRILSAASTALDNGVSVKRLLKAIEQTSEPGSSGKDVKPSSSKTKSKAATFERATKAFGYTLRDGRADPASLKEKFTSNLERAKKEHPQLKASMFNKIMTVGSGKNSEGYLISGLRKTGGEWVFVAYTPEGSKTTVSVADSL